MPLDEETRIVEQSLFDTAWRAPDSVILDRPEWFQVRTPSSPDLWLNAVMLARLGDGIAASIDAVREEHRARGAALRWVVGPSSRPLNLGERLALRGLERDCDALGMIARPAELDLPPGPDDVTVEVVDETTADDFVRVAALGWESPPDEGARMHAGLQRALVEESESKRYYVARLGDEPIGSGLVHVVGEVAMLQGGCVVPGHRGRGVYRALTRQRIADLRDRGTSWVTVIARADTSAPACRRFGFRHAGDLEYFSWRALRAAGEGGRRPATEGPVATSGTASAASRVRAPGRTRRRPCTS